jgi:hypothetical protein
MADETVLTTDQQLDALFATAAPSSAAPAAVPAKEPISSPGKEPAAVASPPGAPKPEGEAPAKADETPVDDPLAALEAIKDEEEGEKKVEDKPAVAALPEEQKAVLDIFPDKQTATKVLEIAQAYGLFTTTFEKGDFKGVESMLSEWNAPAYENFMEHIYNEMVKSGKWVDRFIKEAEDPNFKGTSALQKRLNDLEKRLSAKEQTETQSRQQQQQFEQEKKTAEAYKGKVTELFDLIKLPTGDRRWVASELNNAIFSDKKLFEQVRSGNLSGVPKVFKAVVKEYLTRDKEASTEQKGGTKPDKKPVLAGGTGGAPGASEVLPENVKDVPKDKLGSWVDKSLDALFGKKK